MSITGLNVSKKESPTVKLISLANSDPGLRPRFSLALANLASAIRNDVAGEVSQHDQQLCDKDHIIQEIDSDRPDIIGISVPFGTHEVFSTLLQRIQNIPNYTPLIVLGGSLATLNVNHYLEQNGDVIVCVGRGEVTMKDIIELWGGKRTLEEVRNIKFAGTDGGIVRGKRDWTSPNLDLDLTLLDDTLDANGVFVGEMSSGCQASCSFCPRGAKGLWTSSSNDQLERLLENLQPYYEQRPSISRFISFADEDLFGPDDKNVDRRVVNIFSLLNQYGFSAYVNSRIDNVFRPDRDKDWHTRRIETWKTLTDLGLTRCFVGVESGVESQLSRFNKGVTVEQNTIGLRILSLCEIPVHLGFITFDPLMTLDELVAAYEYQCRTDILLPGDAALDANEIYQTAVSGEIHSPDPLYRKIRFTLGDMKTLQHSKYLGMVKKEGLARSYDLNSGAFDVQYMDARIGLVVKYIRTWKKLVRGLHASWIFTNKSHKQVQQSLYQDFGFDLLGKLIQVIMDNEVDSEEMDNAFSSIVELQLDDLRRSCSVAA